MLLQLNEQENSNDIFINSSQTNSSISLTNNSLEVNLANSNQQNQSNSTYLDKTILFLLYLVNIPSLVKELAFSNINDSLAECSFESKILSLLISILFFIAVLIFIVWNKYSAVIADFYDQKGRNVKACFLLCNLSKINFKFLKN